MMLARILPVVAVLVLVAGCDSGSNSTSFPPVADWFKFRQNVNNTGAGFGAVSGNTGRVRWFVPVDLTPAPGSTPGKSPTPQPVSNSPTIVADGTIYIGSGGGTLAAITAAGDVRWRTNTCDVCPGLAASTPLGPLIASPIAYSFNGVNSVFLGTADGRFVVFQDGRTAATCVACFVPQALDPSITSASFVSSATIITHPLLLNVTGVFVGATVQYNGMERPVGKLYALNSNATLQWEFPAAGSPSIGPVTSSPALATGNTLYFTTDDGLLLSVGVSGAEIWRFPMVSAPVAGRETDMLAPSPLTTGSTVYAASTEGTTVALTLGGQVAWTKDEGDPYDASLTIGAQIILTPTPTPAGVATPTPQAPTTGTATPTPTPTLVSQLSTVFGITRSGILVARDAIGGALLPPSGPLPTPVVGEVESSPAVSADDYLVFATTEGMLYVVSTATALPMAGWPIKVGSGAPIHSSPTIDGKGNIYVGSDDGNLYVLGPE